MKASQILAVAALVIGTSSAQATVLNFEDLVGSDTLANNYGGLTWGADWAHYDFEQYPYSPASGIQRIYNNGQGDADWFKFATDVAFNGAFFAGQDSSTAQFELYLDGVLVHTSSILGLTSTATFLAAGYAGLIDEVRLNVTNKFFVMDDITYDAQQVPEPFALSLFGLGLAALAYSRRQTPRA